MKPDPIYYDCVATDLNNRSINFNTLRQSTALSRRIFTVDHRPLLLNSHLNRMERSFATLHRQPYRFDRKAVEQAIVEMLRYHPTCGNVVRLTLTEDCHTLLEAEQSVAVDRYTLLAFRPMCSVVNYEIPFERHSTQLSLSTADYMDSFAVSNGAHTALRVNRKGEIISSGDCAAMAVVGSTLYASDICDNAERELLISRCKTRGIKFVNKAANIADIANIDEILIASTTGIQSLLCLADRYLTNIIAGRLG